MESGVRNGSAIAIARQSGRRLVAARIIAFAVRGGLLARRRATTGWRRHHGARGFPGILALDTKCQGTTSVLDVRRGLGDNTRTEHTNSTREHLDAHDSATVLTTACPGVWWSESHATASYTRGVHNPELARMLSERK